MSSNNIRRHLMITGRVQGVAFRAHTREEARRRGVTGWVRNTADGRVEAVIEGEEKAVEDMIAWCRNGPPAAKVQNVETAQETYQGAYGDFSIRF